MSYYIVYKPEGAVLSPSFKDRSEAEAVLDMLVIEEEDHNEYAIFEG